ncbi:antitoxin Xre/MbcA/ParS toxin-binding domain-containing protein [Vibrio harveyi]|uniref:antitoxin Xre/MbcA/ParS toxin-binding domain-containing protein n=1 Tax=Vibrio harveyi TaxID=669 RepID=UPI0038CD3D1D
MFSKAYQLLGGEVRNMSNPLQSLVVIRDGLPVLFFEKGREHLSVSKSVYAQLIGVSLSSIQRMKKANMRLSPASSEHVLMLTDLVVQCDSYFDDIEKRNHWLNCPNLSLGNATPISICDTAMGIKLVSEAIVKLKSGFVA